MPTTTTQQCRDCGKLFPYSADADRCPTCAAAMVDTTELVWFVDDLQACEREALPATGGIEVVDLYVDDYGFDRVMVVGPDRDAVIEYVREHWGDDDGDWFRDYVIDRIEEGEV